MIEELRLIADETLGVGMTRIGGAVVKAVEALESQAREIERLGVELENTLIAWGQVRLEIAALKAQPSGVVDSQRLLDWNRSQPEPRPIVVGREYQVAEACARLNQQPASGGDVAERAGLDSSVIEEVIEHMDHVWSGEADEDVTVELTRRLRDFARATLSAPSHGEQVPNKLPGGWTAKPTDDGEGFIISSPRINGVASHFSVFPDSKDYASHALWKMLAAAPSAGSQGGDV